MALSVKRVQKLLRKGERGRFLDGGATGVRGLYLCIESRSNASWALRYQLDSRTHWMGLGSARDRSLDNARSKAKAAREQLADKLDPLQARRAERAAKVTREAETATFKQCAEAFVLGRAKEWKSAKHGKEFSGSLAKFVYPKIGAMDVAQIGRPQVLMVLEQPVKANGLPLDASGTCAP